MMYEILARTTAPGGTVRCIQLPVPSGSPPNATIEVSGSAKEAWITWVGDTNFDQDAGNAASGFTFQGPDPHDTLIALLDNSTTDRSAIFDDILAEHVGDYQAVATTPFALDIGQTSQLDTPTDGLMKKYQVDAVGNLDANVYIEWLIFNFGRYLLTSSARGVLPANLQGKWGNGVENPWGAGKLFETLFIRYS
jgi:alpha-L-fucosidase 2